MTMMSPVLQVGRLTIEDISEGSMPRITGTTQHGKLAIDLAREHHTIAVVRQESILQLMESLEILCPCHTNRWSMITIAPGDIILFAYLAHTRVVAIHPLSYLLVVALHANGFFVDVPVNGILTEASMKRHASVLVITSEDTSKSILISYYGTIEDTIGVG